MIFHLTFQVTPIRSSSDISDTLSAISSKTPPLSRLISQVTSHLIFHPILQMIFHLIPNLPSDIAPFIHLTFHPIHQLMPQLMLHLISPIIFHLPIHPISKVIYPIPNTVSYSTRYTQQHPIEYTKHRPTSIPHTV